MLSNSYSIYTQVKSQSDLYDINKVIHSFADCQTAYADYIAAGYYVYDIPANGGLSYLSGISTALGGGYILACFKSLSPSTVSTIIGTQASAATSNSFYLASTASSVDDFYNGAALSVTIGGVKYYNYVKDYIGASRKCVVSDWSSTPTSSATYAINFADYCSTEDITRFNNVVYMGVKINSNNAVTDFLIYNPTYLHINEGAYNSKLTMQYNRQELSQDFYTGGANIYGVNYKNCELTADVDGGATYINLYDTIINDVNIYVKGTGTASTSLTTINPFVIGYSSTASSATFNIDNITVQNSGAWGSIGFRTNSTNIVSLNNVYVSGNSSQTNFSLYTLVSSSNKFFRLNNVLLYNTSVLNSSHVSAEAGYNTLLYGGTVSAKSDLNNIQLVRAPLYYQVIDNGGMLTLDTATILSTSAYTRLDCDILQINAERITPAGKVLRNYYNLSFRNDMLCNSSDFKEIGVNDLVIVERTEENNTLLVGGSSAKRIKNLQIYNDDFSSIFNFRKNENFFIVAETTQAVASSTQAVLMWYNGELRGSIFDQAGYSGWLPDTWYSVRYCFQLWEIQNDNGSGFRATVKNSTSSPIERSLSVNNLDNEYVQ